MKIINNLDILNRVNPSDKIMFKNYIMCQSKGMVQKVRQHTIPAESIFSAITLRDAYISRMKNDDNSFFVDNIISCYFFGECVEVEEIIKTKIFGIIPFKYKKIPDTSSILNIMCFINKDNFEYKKNNGKTKSWKISYHNSLYEETHFLSVLFKTIFISSDENIYSNNKYISEVYRNGVCFLGEDILGTNRKARWKENISQESLTCIL